MSIVGEFGTCDTDGAASDLQDITRPGPHAQKVGGRQSRDGVADVFDARLRDAQCQGCSGRWGHFRCRVNCNRLWAGDSVEEFYPLLLLLFRMIWSLRQDHSALSTSQVRQFDSPNSQRRTHNEKAVSIKLRQVRSLRRLQ